MVNEGPVPHNTPASENNTRTAGESDVPSPATTVAQTEVLPIPETSLNSDRDAVSNGMELNFEGIELFDEADVFLEYQAFFEQFESDTSLTEEEIQYFFTRMLATLENSETARNQISKVYRNMDSDAVVERSIMQEMLMKTATGQAILIDEAENILNTGQQELYPYMFEIYSNVEDDISYPVLEKAIESTYNSTDIRNSVSALNYIGKLESSEMSSSMYLYTTMNALRDVANNNEDESVRGLAVQKLYRLTPPAESTQIAINYLTSDANTPLVMETLYSIGSGDVALNEPLRFALHEALNRTGVTSAELELANNILGEV
ncbi:hypothetical Protein YC6258_01796 [Gynuella sunshinyii YC6258]|uniref:HEAT repeat domain-containing protein n=1 Tax=Gynuella sunshinyii YC6258 TaxID=1445510 RepID=A0A0C5V2W1_9GAMM|nr:hypothetical Protein YC6258_01796 [Gynuella sunshinyii YC6258]